jgi:hypothetical protein
MFGSLQISKSKNFVLKSHKTTWTTTCFFWDGNKSQPAINSI